MISRVDLHVHSSASDGRYSATQVVARAVSRQLQAIAITDHDTVDGIQEALSAKCGAPVDVIPGVELNAYHPASEVHILGYHIDHTNPVLLDALSRLRDSRLDRAERMVRKLLKMGVRVEARCLREIAGTAVLGRPHIAKALVKLGYVRSISEAFQRYIGRDGPAYVDRFRLSPTEAIRLVLAAGGLPVLAHPLDVLELLDDLSAVGLCGLEVYHTGYTDCQTSRLIREAEAHDLLLTGGSDFHGGGVFPEATLGGVPVPVAVVEGLKARKQLLVAHRRGGAYAS